MIRLVLLLALICGFAAPARAEGPVLIELFASKNCRTCPAAYKTLGEVEAEHGRKVLIITWPVDYWDYLGTKEKMALPESKDRQRGYVERFSLRGPYTPQAVFNGTEQTAGNKPAKVAAAIDKAKSAEAADVRLKRYGNSVRLTGSSDSLVDIWWVTYLSGAENTTKMPNPVTAVRQIGPWLGGRADITLPECVAACVLIVQEAGFGRVLATLPVR